MGYRAANSGQLFIIFLADYFRAAFIPSRMATVHQGGILVDLHCDAPNVCRNPKTLHRIPRTGPVVGLSNGEHSPMGLETGIKRRPSKIDVVKAQVNCDSTTVFRSLNAWLPAIFSRVIKPHVLQEVYVACGSSNMVCSFHVSIPLPEEAWRHNAQGSFYCFVGTVMLTLKIGIQGLRNSAQQLYRCICESMTLNYASTGAVFVQVNNP